VYYCILILNYIVTEEKIATVSKNAKTESNLDFEFLDKYFSTK